MSDTDVRHRALLIAGETALNAGDFGRVREIADEIFSFAPGSLNGFWLYMMSGRIAPGDAVFARIEMAARHRTLDNAVASQLQFMLGKGYDDQARHAEAFTAFVAANRLKGARHDPVATRRTAEALIAAWRAIPDITLSVNPPRLVFVLGMPRSGTSLAAQMLGRHPSVANLGEQTALGAALGAPDPVRFVATLDKARLETARRAYLEGIGAAQRPEPFLVDKMPENYWFAGLIPLLFPDAVILHMRRPRLATCWSCFRNDFRAGHAYSYDFRQLLAQYDTHLRLTAAARERSGPRWREIDLEHLTADPHGTLTPVLVLLGLDWDSACLTPEAGGETATLSKWQVRQGIDPGIPKGWQAYRPLIRKTWGVDA